jgi:hypothetical protein
VDKDALLRELTKWSEIARASNPILEMEIRKVLDQLRDVVKLPAEKVDALEKMLRAPEKLIWQRMPTLPDKPLNWTPEKFQVEWFRDFISKMKDGTEWHVPSTGHVYKIDKTNKTFTLTHDVEHDPNDWHERNKMILALLGYSMIDNKSSAKTYSSVGDHWIVAVFDFSIETQENSATPGKNFPHGSRGQDAVATPSSGGALVRLGHDIGRYLWKHVEPAYGAGKTSAAWTALFKQDKDPYAP